MSNDNYVDVRDIHPDWSTMECWNCGHEERIGPNREMRICQNCFMDNNPMGEETEYTVEGPDGRNYTDYRLVWYGDVELETARAKYNYSAQGADEWARQMRAKERTVKL